MKAKTTLLACLVVVALAGAALAQTAAPSTSVTIPWGEWLIAARDAAVAILLALITFAFRALPSNIAAMLNSARVIQIVEKGIDYGFNAVEGAVKGKALTVNVGSEVVAQAVQYVVDQAPAWMIQWAGGEDGIRRMVIARLPVAENAALQ